MTSHNTTNRPCQACHCIWCELPFVAESIATNMAMDLGSPDSNEEEDEKSRTDDSASVRNGGDSEMYDCDPLFDMDLESSVDEREDQTSLGETIEEGFGEQRQTMEEDEIDDDDEVEHETTDFYGEDSISNYGYEHPTLIWQPTPSSVPFDNRSAWMHQRPQTAEYTTLRRGPQTLSLTACPLRYTNPPLSPNYVCGYRLCACSWRSAGAEEHQ